MRKLVFGRIAPTSVNDPFTRRADNLPGKKAAAHGRSISKNSRIRGRDSVPSMRFAKGVARLSTHSDDAHRRAEALFKKDQQARKGRQGMAQYQANLDAMREKTSRLRALRLARDATNEKRPLPTH
jgi:hypothetical protein